MITVINIALQINIYTILVYTNQNKTPIPI